jgi:hypothetical protein
MSPPNSAAAAAIAAGQRFLASPTASAASSAEFRMQQQQQVVAVSAADFGQVAGSSAMRGGAITMAPAASPYQMMAPAAPVMVGPDGQTVYYMTPPQVNTAYCL